MKKLKRFASILLAVILVCSLFLTTACDLSDSDSDREEEHKHDGYQDKDYAHDGDDNDKDEQGDEFEHECSVSEWKTTDSTCLTAGKMEGECKICGKTVTKALPLKDHNVEKLDAVAPTCSSTGLTEGEKCVDCGTVIKAQTVIAKDASAHVTNAIPEKQPTCTEPGYLQGMKCELCGFVTVETVVVPAKGHAVVDVPEQPAKCEETGLTAGQYCRECNITLIERTVIPALGHDKIEEGGVAPTCTKPGLEPIIRCSICYKGFDLDQEEIPATGHTEKTVAGKAATCTSKGLTDGKVCRDCGIVMSSQRPINASGHSFDANNSCEGCHVTLSIGLSYEENSSGDGYIVIGIGDFSGTELVIPETYSEKPVLEIKANAFSGNTDLKKVVILGNVTKIGEGAFSGCTALEEVTVSASVVDVESGAFGNCPQLEIINGASLTQIRGWAADFASGELQIRFTDGLSPYQVYLEALSTLQRNISNYTMESDNMTYMNYGGQEIPMLRIEQSVKNNGKNFYNYTKQTDYMSSQGETVTESKVWYVGGCMYAENAAMNVGYEYIRATSMGSNLNNAVLTEEYFDGAVFYRNADGTYYLKLVMDPSSMGDLMNSLMAEQYPDVTVTVSSAEYVYGFTAEGAIASCKSDVSCVAGGMAMRVNNDMRFSNIGSTTITAPTGYTFYQVPPCSTHASANIVDVPELEAGCLAQGRTAGQYCKACLQDVTSSTIVHEKGHSFENGVCGDCGYMGNTPVICYELSADQTYYTVVFYEHGAEIPATLNGLPVITNP